MTWLDEALKIKNEAFFDAYKTDFPYPNWTSNCCNAPLISETDICSRCKEHCEPEEVK